jgi:hypothetical protein
MCFKWRFSSCSFGARAGLNELIGCGEAGNALIMHWYF